MNDQSQIMSQSQILSQPPAMSQSIQSQRMNHSQMLNQSQPMNQSQMLNQNQGAQIMTMNQSQQTQLMSQAVQMVSRSYGMWPQPLRNPPMDSMNYPNQLKPVFSGSKSSKPSRSNWKGKKPNTDMRSIKQNKKPKLLPNNSGVGICATSGNYHPPSLQELQSQNRAKARRFYHSKKKFNNRFAPFAPRNTTSFIIRAKKAGGIASLVSPCPVTPAVLPTPIFSPSREVLGDMAKEEWGVDGYGSMKGLIRLRSPGNDGDMHEEEDEDEGGSSESDVEEHVEVERRLDHDLSRFEMIYPNCGGADYNNVLENRVDDQDTHIAQLEEENLTLKERLFIMERELDDLRRRLQFLERHNQVLEDVNEEVVENGSENESESSGRRDLSIRHPDDNEEGVETKLEDNCAAPENENDSRELNDVCMEEFRIGQVDFIVEDGACEDEATDDTKKDEMKGLNNEVVEGGTGSSLRRDLTVGHPENNEELVETKFEDYGARENENDGRGLNDICMEEVRIGQVEVSGSKAEATDYTNKDETKGLINEEVEGGTGSSRRRDLPIKHPEDNEEVVETKIEDYGEPEDEEDSRGLNDVCMAEVKIGQVEVTVEDGVCKGETTDDGNKDETKGFINEDEGRRTGNSEKSIGEDDLSSHPSLISS